MPISAARSSTRLGAPPPPPTGAAWTRTLPAANAYAYLPDLDQGIRSNGGTITATLTSPSDTDFRFLLISIDRYQVVAEATGTGSTKQLRFDGPAGRYAWYVQSVRGAGAFRIEGTVPCM